MQQTLGMFWGSRKGETGGGGQGIRPRGIKHNIGGDCQEHAVCCGMQRGGKIKLDERLLLFSTKEAVK